MRYFLISLFVVASTAKAENWQQIANLDSGEGILFFDTAAVSQVNGLRRAWFKSVYKSDQPISAEYREAVSRDVRSYRSEVAVRYFNCTERKSALMRLYWHSADEKVVGHFHNEVLLFREVQPETPEKLMLEAACNYAGDFADADAEAARLRSPPKAKIVRAVDPEDYYPPSSIRREEQGSPVVRVCVGTSGELLREPAVTYSSGFADLDGAAIEMAKAMQFAPGMENGIALPESCVQFKIKFALTN